MSRRDEARRVAPAGRGRRRAIPWLAAASVAVALLAACGGGGAGGSGGDGEGASAELPLPAVGPIPGAEFATVPPPTFNQVIAAYRKVTTADPALLGDEPALSRALFDEVRRTTGMATGGRARALAATRQALFDLDARLTLEEWKLVIRSPVMSAQAAGTIEASAQAAIERLPCDADIGFADGKADALRHAYWSALMTRRTTAAFAELFATAHETGSTNRPEASAMDLHNNAFGRAFATALPEAGEGELLQMLVQRPFAFVPAGAALPGVASGLVFIDERARRPFDGVFTGTLTAPDRGAGAWTVDFHLARVRGICTATIAPRARAW